MRISEFRSQAKIMLAVVIVAFVGLIFFQWGMQITGKIRGEVPKEVIGVVGKRNIKIREYVETMQKIANQIPGTPTPQLLDSIRYQAWSDLVMDRIYSQLMAKEGLRVTSDEILAIIKNTPPPEIANNPEFRNEKGEFDFQKYHQLLRDRRNIAWVLNYEYRIRKEYPKRKVDIALATLGWLTPTEMELFTKLFSTNYTGVIISFPFANYSSQVDTSAELLRAYYEKHIEEWKVPERRQCQYVFFPKVPSPKDTQDLKRRKRELDEDLDADIEFLSLAQDYTNNPQVILTTDQLTNDLKSKVSRIRVGSIEKIAEDHQHIYLKRVASDTIYRIVLKILISHQTVYDIQDRIKSFISTAQEIGFNQAAEEFNLETHLTYPFEQDRVNFPSLRGPNQLARFGFGAKPGDISDPLVGKGGYYIFSLADIKPPQTLPYQKVSHWIKSKYLKIKAKELAQRDAQRCFLDLQAGKGIDVIVDKYPRLKHIAVKNKVLTEIKKIYGTKLAGTILKLTPGESSNPLTTEWATYIAVVKDLRQISDKEILAIVNRLRQIRAEYIFQKTLNAFQIKDYRDYQIE